MKELRTFDSGQPTPPNQPVYDKAGFRVGDRVIVNIGDAQDPQYYGATVTAVSPERQKIRVVFADGKSCAESVDNTATGVVAYLLGEPSVQPIGLDVLKRKVNRNKWIASTLEIQLLGLLLGQSAETSSNAVTDHINVKPTLIDAATEATDFATRMAAINAVRGPRVADALKKLAEDLNCDMKTYHKLFNYQKQLIKTSDNSDYRRGKGLIKRLEEEQENNRRSLFFLIMGAARVKSETFYFDLSSFEVNLQKLLERF